MTHYGTNGTVKNHTLFDDLHLNDCSVLHGGLSSASHFTRPNAKSQSSRPSPHVRSGADRTCGSQLVVVFLSNFRFLPNPRNATRLFSYTYNLFQFFSINIHRVSSLLYFPAFLNDLTARETRPKSNHCRTH